MQGGEEGGIGEGSSEGGKGSGRRKVRGRGGKGMGEKGKVRSLRERVMEGGRREVHGQRVGRLREISVTFTQSLAHPLPSSTAFLCCLHAWCSRILH